MENRGVQGGEQLRRDMENKCATAGDISDREGKQNISCRQNTKQSELNLLCSQGSVQQINPHQTHP